MPIDYSKYPPNWRSEIVPRIIERARYRCEFCEVTNGMTLWSVPLSLREDGRYKKRRIWMATESDVKRISALYNKHDLKQVRVVLTVAHLDHDELNHDVTDDRLAALCQWCHLNYDAKEKYRRACVIGE